MQDILERSVGGDFKINSGKAEKLAIASLGNLTLRNISLSPDKRSEWRKFLNSKREDQEEDVHLAMQSFLGEWFPGIEQIETVEQWASGKRSGLSTLSSMAMLLPSTRIIRRAKSLKIVERLFERVDIGLDKVAMKYLDQLHQLSGNELGVFHQELQKYKVNMARSRWLLDDARKYLLEERIGKAKLALKDFLNRREMTLVGILQHEDNLNVFSREFLKFALTKNRQAVRLLSDR